MSNYFVYFVYLISQKNLHIILQENLSKLKILILIRYNKNNFNKSSCIRRA